MSGERVTARGGRRTKLVCTIGPASVGRIGELVAAGLDVARLNLSHGTWDEHAAAVAEVRRAAEEAGRSVAVLADLPGPKIRLGDLAGGEVELEAGAAFELRPPGAHGDARGAATSHARLADDLRPGDRVLLADGAVELRVEANDGGVLTTAVERGGTVRSRAGVGVPSERLSLPALTERDRAALPFVREAGVDLVGQSFVRSAADVEELRAALGADGPGIVAKIETRPAVDRIAAILVAADAVMVARGDLGVELPFEEVPLVQKRLVHQAVVAERPVIVATQMLESMVAAPRPTRAEASDVANAVLDGADAVMLSAETAIGAHPVLAAQAAARIAAAADRAALVGVRGPRGVGDALPADDARAVCVAAVALAVADPDVALIACFTRTGRTARVLAALRPATPILAVTPSERVARALVLHRAVVTTAVAPAEGADEIGRRLREELDRRRAGASLPEGAAVVLVASTAGGGPGPNLVEVVRA